MKAVDTIHLFEDLSQELIYFLAELKPDEWNTPSPIAGRSVKDLAAHLADGSMRRISMQRDHYFPAHQHDLTQYEQLIDYIQELNQSWMEAMRRLSPRVIMEMIKKYDKEVFELFSALKPEDDALLPVAWAYQQVSPNWFDIAREYTEKWHHQMQMRMATGRTLLMSERFLKPVYETFLLALPAHLNHLALFYENHLLEIEITGEIRLRNRLHCKNQVWSFVDLTATTAQTSLRIPASIGWILFTNTDRNISNYLNNIVLEGNTELGYAVLNLKTVLS